jgi:hypothetical protein
MGDVTGSTPGYRPDLLERHLDNVPVCECPNGDEC